MMPHLQNVQHTNHVERWNKVLTLNRRQIWLSQFYLCATSPHQNIQCSSRWTFSIISWFKKHFPVTRNRLKPHTDPTLRSWHERTEPTKEEVILSLRRAKEEKCMKVKWMKEAWMKWRVWLAHVVICHLFYLFHHRNPSGPLHSWWCHMLFCCFLYKWPLCSLPSLMPVDFFSKEQKPFFVVSIPFQGCGGAKCLVWNNAVVLWFVQEVWNITIWNQGLERQKLTFWNVPHICISPDVAVWQFGSRKNPTCVNINSF